MTITGVEKIDINMGGKQVLIIRGPLTMLDSEIITDRVNDWLISEEPVMVLIAQPGISIELAKVGG
jgi:hypothetical protein